MRIDMEHSSISFFVGDSMIWNVFGDKLTNSVKNEDHFLNCSFIEAETHRWRTILNQLQNCHLIKLVMVLYSTSDLPSNVQWV